MVLVQLGVSAADAFARLRAHAFAEQRLLGDVARDVVARRLTFTKEHVTATGIGKGTAWMSAGTAGEQLLIRRSSGWPTRWSTTTTSSICSTAWSATASSCSPPTRRDPAGRRARRAAGRGLDQRADRVDRAAAAAGRRGPLRGVFPHRRPGQRRRPGRRGIALAAVSSPPCRAGGPTARCTPCRCGCAARPSAR